MFQSPSACRYIREALWGSLIVLPGEHSALIVQLPEGLDKSGFLVVPPYYLMDLGDSRWVSPLVLIEPESLFD